MRVLPTFGQERIGELEKAWKDKQSERSRKRLLVIRLVVQHQLKAGQIAQVAGISRSVVFHYINKFAEAGVEGLLATHYPKGSRGKVDEQSREALKRELAKGTFKRVVEAQRWLEKRSIKLSLSTVYYHLGKAGGVLKVPRKTHANKDAAKTQLFREKLAERLVELAQGASKVRIWVADEHRYGLLPVIRRCWALRGKRVYAPYATRYQWGYLHEALEVDGQNRSEFLFMPTVCKDISNIFLKQISEVEPEALHLVIWDGAGFHPLDGETGVPANVRLIKLPPYSPELNPVEGLGDRIKDAVSNRLWSNLRSLEEAIIEEIADIRAGGMAVAGMIHDWMFREANASDPI
jgi:transposase